MPIYEFKCKNNKCEKVFESLIKPWDDRYSTYKGVICPHCKYLGCERIISAHGGYTIKGNNSASQKPKSSGSFKK